MPISWSRQEVELVEHSEGRARLRVTSEEEFSSAEEKLVDLVLVEGKWIPSQLAVQWEERIGQARSYLNSLKSRKQRDPQYLSRRLSELGQQIEYLTLFIMDILESLAPQTSGS